MNAEQKARLAALMKNATPVPVAYRLYWNDVDIRQYAGLVVSRNKTSIVQSE